MLMLTVLIEAEAGEREGNCKDFTVHISHFPTGMLWERVTWLSLITLRPEGSLGMFLILKVGEGDSQISPERVREVSP